MGIVAPRETFTVEVKFAFSKRYLPRSEFVVQVTVYILVVELQDFLMLCSYYVDALSNTLSRVELICKMNVQEFEASNVYCSKHSYLIVPPSYFPDSRI